MKDYKNLLLKYRELFCEYFKPTEQHMSPMKFGIECMVGWYDLIDNLCSDIMKICKEENLNIPIVSQVKEKFGGLRFYIDLPDDKDYSNIYDRIVEAERASYAICELCGSTENIGMTTGWIQVICKKCYDDSDQTSQIKNRLWKSKIEWEEFSKRFKA
jgi:hypothetical protein